MKIKRVEIENFKSIKKVSFILNDFICFVGENSQGKSNILKAIKVFIKNETPDVEDLYVLEDEKSDFSKITLTFNKIKQQTKEKLVEIFGDDIFNTDQEFILAYNIEKNIKTNKIPAPNYEILSSPKEIKVAPKEKTILLELFPELHFAPALCNITEETKANNKSLFSKVANIIREKQQDKETEELIEAFQKYRKKVEDTTGQTISSLSEVQDGLEEFLAEWGATAEVRIKLPEISQILKENLIININDGVTTPAEYKGHGFQRSLLFALLRLLAKLNKANPENVREHIFIFEEPEMYLHPQMCKATYKTFKELSQSNQVLISTHSSHFIDLKDYNSIAIVRKNKELS
jgi:CRISPR-associated exonuclease Cas4